jgi:hypothetical protein
LGVGASKLTRQPNIQGNLFEENPQPRLSALDQAVDSIRTQFGAASIQRGCLLDWPVRRGDESGPAES